MRKVRTLDACRPGSRTVDQGPLDNGQLPHGGYKGSHRHPLSILSFHKGDEFQENLAQELQRMLRDDETIPVGTSPSWAILLHRAPSHSDESPLLANNLLTVSKLGQTMATNSFNQNSLESTARCKSMRDLGRLYYRPNSTHQFLSATDLRDCAEEQINVNYGRPTRTSLLRTLQRRNSAGANSYHTRKDFLHRLHDLRNSNETNPITEYFKSGKTPDGQRLHSFLTGARYNRYNPTLGCCFTENKADEKPSLQTGTRKQRNLLASTYLLRPSTTPGQGSRNEASWDFSETNTDIQTTHLTLKVIGNRPSMSNSKDHSFKLPDLQTVVSPGRHSKCLKRHSFGLYSSRSNSAKADSDIQDISDSVKNAIIASTEETDPGCLEAIEKAGSGVTDLERIETDTKVGTVLVNLIRGSLEDVSPTSLPVISLPADVPGSIRQGGENQEVIESETNNQEDGIEKCQDNVYKQSDSTDEDKLGNYSADDNEDDNDQERDNRDLLVTEDSIQIHKSLYIDDGFVISSDRNDTPVNNVLEENNENNNSLTGNTHSDQMYSREAGEVINEDDDSPEAEEDDDEEDDDVAQLVPEDDTVTFFITEENEEDGEKPQEGNLQS